MSAWVIYTQDHDYFAVAMNDQCRDAFLREVAVVTHREGYAEPYPVAIKTTPRPAQRYVMGKWLDQVADQRASQKEAAE